MSTRFIKDPDAVLDYHIDWSKWLADSDEITASSFTADAGIVVDSDDFTDDTTVVWLSGGTAGRNYNVVNHITTQDGREEDRTLYIAVKER